jgi:PAS domain S-box-containing protein
MNESSFRLLLLRFALFPVLCLFLFVAAISFQVHRISEERARASQATSTLLQCDRLLNTLVDEETGVRGFVASGDPSFLEPYRSATSRVDGELNALSQAASTNASIVSAIRSDFQQFEAINRQMIAANAEQRGNVQALREQKQTMDSLRAELEGLTAKESAVRDEGIRKLARMYATLPISAVVGGAIVAFFLVWDGIAQFRRISRAFRDQIKQIELQRSSLHTTLQSIGDAVIVCNEAGIITLFNQTAETVTGWSVAQAIGQHLDRVFVIVNETTRQSVESPVEKVLRTGQVVGLANHTVLIRRDGLEVAIDDSGAPIRDEKSSIVGVVLVFRDIQERRKAERELILRSAELESLLANSPAGFATFDRAYRFVRVNQSLARIDGVPETEHLGRTVADIVPAMSTVFSTIIDRVFEQGISVHREFTGQTEREPGVERQWLTWFYPVFTGESAEPVLVGAIALDTTERWHAQQALVQTEKLAAVGRLAASIAHEMNNPLSSVTNLLYLIACDETLNEATRGFVDRASVELDRVSKIATQTLRFARRTVAPSQVNIEEIIHGMMLLFGGRLTQNQVKVSVRRRRVSSFYGYASEVMQLLTNLLSNAIDAIGEAGKITIAIQDSRDWRTSTPCVAVSIADSGPGISPLHRQKIWEPFFTTKSETGTGLGLWLVDETVRKNGGSIRMRTATSEVQHGTVFRLLLPIRPSASVLEDSEPA